MLERMISVDEMARLTGWHPMTIYRKAASGEIPGRVKLGKSLRFKESKIKEWLDDPSKDKNVSSPGDAVS